MSENTVIEYPTGLSSIPYASFLEIQKFSYEEAQKYAAENFNDALGSLGRSAIARKVDQAVDGLATVYGSGDTSTEKGKINLYETQYKSAKTTGRNRTRKTIDINTADDSTRIVLKNGETTTVGALKKRKQEAIDRQNKGLMSKKCMLPLPNEFQYKYGAEWNNEFKLGTLALAADEAYRFGAITGAGGAIGGLVNYLTSKVTGGGKVPGADQATKIVQGVADGMKTAADPFKVGSELNPKNVAGLAGLAPNENSIQFFERMTGREFSFRFELASRNKNESNRVIDIIEWFKRGMHPGSKNGKGTAVLLTFPDVFVLTPKFVKCTAEGAALGDPIQHPMMPRTKLCALTGLTINTTPFGQMQTVFDGSIPIVTMELQFKETTKLTRVDMEGSSFAEKDNALQTNSGVFSRDTTQDNKAEVSF